MTKKATIFLLDNVDSFTYNLVDEIRTMGFELHIYRNTVALDTIVNSMHHTEGEVMLMLSPGPGAPSTAGCMSALLASCIGHYPVLGVCLGHQAIVEHYGGRVGHCHEVVHGKAALMEHVGEAMFANLESPLSVARYHSLMATEVPPSLSIVANINDIPMAVYQPRDRVLGLQFHPESILTADGSQLLRQSIDTLLARTE